MSLKRKCNFDRITSSSPTCPEDDSSMTMKYIKTDEFFNENSHSSDEQLAASPQSNSDEKKISSPTVNRRKATHSQLKHLQPPPTSSSSTSSSSSSSNKTSISMILNLIESLVDEKQLEKNNDENLLLTIDCLISNLKYLREKINTIHHDDTHPLNLTKPKVTKPTHEINKSTTTSTNFPMPSTLFPTQPFFPPFSGRMKRIVFENEL